MKAAGGTVELLPPEGLRVAAPHTLAEQVKAHKPDIIRVLLAAAPIQALDRDDFDERAAIIEANGVPREWAEGLATLDRMPPPPTTYAPERWAQIVNDGGLFLDRWRRGAAALGWKATDVFGVDPDAPECRYDGMGLIALLTGRSVCDISKDAAVIDCGGGVVQTFQRKTMDAGAVAVWTLK